MAGHGSGYNPHSAFKHEPGERPYTRIERERNYFKEQARYWKDRAGEQNGASYKDGVAMGCIATLSVVVVGSIVLLLMFSI